MTGHGLKDTAVGAARCAGLPYGVPVDADRAAVALGLAAVSAPAAGATAVARRDGPTVRVRCPATSANLGPGFDALGLALDLVDEVVVEAVGTDAADVRVEVDGEGPTRSRSTSATSSSGRCAPPSTHVGAPGPAACG